MMSFPHFSICGTLGYKLAIVSNWDTPLDPLTERLGIADYFDTITASHDMRVRSEKPDSHIFNYTLEAVGVSAAEAVHVGRYVRGGYRRGARCRHSSDIA